jgi:predicted RNase H-like HicB family nuclease
MATNKYKYLVEVFWSEEDQGYIAIAPDLPGCSAFGETPIEAIQEVGDAMESWLQACEAMGRPLPEPLARPRQAA